MNLPLILDIAIGLVFVYLTLSLLASELQELLATLLQWRAEHLRKSIENLLSGGENTSEEESIKGIVNDLYNNPLIRNINQEDKEGVAGLFRQVTWQYGNAYRALIHKPTTTFGTDRGQERQVKYKRSAPSYIPAETFASTLLARLNITTLAQKLSVVKLISFKNQEIISVIETSILNELQVSETTQSQLDNELKKLKRNIEKIIGYFKNEKLSLVNTINRIEDELDRYIENSKTLFTDAEAVSKRQLLDELETLKKDTFLNSNDLTTRLTPGLTEITDVLRKGSKAYEEFQETSQDQDSEIYQAFQEIDQEIKLVIGKLPESVLESLSALATRAKIKAQGVEQELNQFKKEIEVWFDRSMDRASGVYKRNAKGVAFLIGSFLAFAANADTFHIIGRLAKDTPLRAAITQNAGQAIGDQDCPSFNNQNPSIPQPPEPVSSKLDCVRNTVNRTLDKVSLPIGRSSENLIQQKEEGRGWQFMGISFSPLRRILGWLLSGLAISMGAPFWFELLGKLINVRNTGPKPTSSTEDQRSPN